MASSFLDAYLRLMLQRESQDAALERDRLNDERRGKQSIIDRAMADPVFARQQAARPDAPPELASLNPTDEMLTAPLGEEIAKATELGQVRTPSDLVFAAGARGVDTTPQLTGRRIQNIGPEGSLPSANLAVGSRPPIEQLLQQRAGKVSAINTANEMEDQRAAGLARTTAYETAVGKNNAANVTLPDEISRFNRTAKETAPAIRSNAFEQSRGQVRGEWLDPEVNTARLEYAEALNANAAANRPPTEGNLRAAGQLQPLINAHAILTKLEGSNIGMRGGLETVVRTPTLANTEAIKNFYGPDTMAYGQAAEEWTNIAGYIISGVQVRADERGNFMAAMIPNAEDPPQVKAQKQRSREAFLQAAQISAGRAGDIAGAALAQAVQRGDIPLSLIQSLQMSPEVQLGFTSFFSDQQ